MDVCCDELLTPGWLVTKIHPDSFTLTMIVKACCPLEPGRLQLAPADESTVTGDVHWGDDPQQSVYYESDLAPHKARADVLLVGSAYAPSGRDVRKLRVGFRVGDQVVKQLDVHGDREWERTPGGARAAKPRPLRSTPLRYERAHGGVDVKNNPVGVGRDLEAPPPNLESVSDAADRSAPAGFGPLAKSWAPRSGMVGTYDDDWQRNRWPWLPADFDWNYFNAAPLDQQVDGYLRGDEEIELRFLHEKYPALHCRLPAIRARAFLHERAPAKNDDASEGELRFREIPLNLDTLWIDTDAEQVVLVWRGLADVRTFKIDEVEHMLVASESLDQPKQKQEYLATLQRWLEDDGEPDDPEFALIEKQIQADQERAEQELEAAKKQAAAIKAERIAAGADPADFDPGPPPSMQAGLKETRSQLVDMAGEANAQGDSTRASELTSKIGEIDQVLELLGPEPPCARETLRESVRNGASLAEQHFSNLDLSGLDLGGADFRNAIFANVNLAGANLAGANLSGAILDGINLADADLRGAILDDASLDGARLAGADLAGVSLVDASLNNLELPGADFTDLKGKGAEFSGSNLNGCKFVRAELPEADFSGCRLEHADFSGALLDDADFDGAQARGINLEGARAAGLRASDESDLTSARCRKLQGPKSNWDTSILDGADFSGAVLVDAVFTAASMREAVFHCADLAGAELSDTCLAKADLTSANLLRASFDRADLEGADFQASNLYEAGFWDAKTSEADFSGANLKNTLLG